MRVKIMKPSLGICLILAVLIFSIPACSRDAQTEVAQADVPSGVVEATSVPTATHTPVPTLTPTLTPTPTPTSTPTQTPTDTPTPTPTQVGGGGMIAFSSVRLGSRFEAPQSDIVLLDPASGDLNWLTGENVGAVRLFPSFSPDGNEMIFTRDDMLCTVDLDGGEKEVESPFGSAVYHPSWSKNGEIISLYAPAGKYPQLWSSTAGEDNWQTITPDITFQFDPVWSPDGSEYAFSGAPGTIFSEWVDLVFFGFNFGFRSTNYNVQARDIFIVDPITSEMISVTSGDEDDYHPAWSPDGQKLAFVTLVGDDNPEIFVANRDGTGLERMTTSLADDLHPSWSPDGQTLAFSSNRDGNFEIYIVQVADKKTTRMTVNLMDDLEPNWGVISSAAEDSGDPATFAPKEMSMKEVADRLFHTGLISSKTGRTIQLQDYSREWAQLGWYTYNYTGENPSNFILRADASWESASDKADWDGAGCGIVFREQDLDNHYFTWVGMDGIARIRKWKSGNIFNVGTSRSAYPFDTPADGANLMLAVDGNNMSVFVNGLLLLNQQDSSMADGSLALTLFSGTNKDFGTRCSMENIELWVID